MVVLTVDELRVLAGMCRIEVERIYGRYCERDEGKLNCVDFDTVQALEQLEYRIKLAALVDDDLIRIVDSDKVAYWEFE